MTTLSITSIKTMGYDAEAAAHGFAIIERLANVTGALLQATRRLGTAAAAPAARSAQA